MLKYILFLAFLIGGAFSAQAATLTVPAGGNLQSALNAAQPGDHIIVEAGATFVGKFVLPVKNGTATITIESSRVSELPEGVRVGPGQAGLMAHLRSNTNGEPVIVAALGAANYRLIGLDIATLSESVVVYDLVRFGEGRFEQTTLAQVPRNIVLDRSYVHGWPNQDVQRGVTLNGANCDVTNSYISEIHGVGFDTQAIGGWNGPGPYQIINNYLEAAGENIMFGGADPGIFGLVPSDILIQRNSVFKPLSWKVGDPSYAGKHWTVKNLLELKNAKNVTIDGNMFENCWSDAQYGDAVLFTVRNQDGTAPWSILENITFTNNTVKNATRGIQTLGIDYSHPSQQASRLRVANNLFIDVSDWGLTLNGFRDMTIEHNTHFQKSNVIVFTGQQSLGLAYRNNLTARDPNSYGVFGDGLGEGLVGLTAYAPECDFAGNIVAAALSSMYPAGNFYPASLGDVQIGSDYRLLPTSPYKNQGTDGKDPGVDVDALMAAQTGAGSPLPIPTPTPAVTPLPTPVPSPVAGIPPASAVEVVSRVNVREGASITSAFKFYGEPGQRGTTVGDCQQDPWSVNVYCFVNFVDGTNGYVAMQYLSVVAQPTPEPSPSPSPTPSPLPTPSPSPSPTPAPSPSPSPTPKCRKFNPKGKCVQWV